jgi:uncharacterized phiE125 gp8 family phage protein
VGLVRTIEPKNLPVDFAEAKKQCEIGESDTAHDSHIKRLIAAATADVERHTRRALITQTWRLSLREFPQGNQIELPRPRLQSVSSITYVNTSGTTVTIDASEYQVSTDASPGYVEPAYSKSWPSVRTETADAIKITYVAGYGSTYSSVPEQFRNVVYELVAFRFVRRGDDDISIPKHIQWALDSLKCGARFGYYGVKQ